MGSTARTHARHRRRYTVALHGMRQPRAPARGHPDLYGLAQAVPTLPLLRPQQEMIGLCTVLGEPVDPIAAVLLQTDPMKYFMRAYDNYSRPPAAMAAAAAAAAAAAGGGAPAPAVPAGHTAVSKLGRMLATRVIMLGAAVQMAFGRPRAASEALMRAQSEEENARAGLLLEQVGGLLRGLVPVCCRVENE